MNYKNQKNDQGSVGILALILLVVVVASSSVYFLKIKPDQTPTADVEINISEEPENFDSSKAEFNQSDNNLDADESEPVTITPPIIQEEDENENVIEITTSVSEPEKVYVNFKNEFEMTSNFDEALEVVLKYSTEEKAVQYAKQGEETPEEDKEGFFSFMKLMSPPISDVTVTNVNITNGDAILSASTADSTGTITLKKEYDVWKIIGESWKTSNR